MAVSRKCRYACPITEPAWKFYRAAEAVEGWIFRGGGGRGTGEGRGVRTQNPSWLVRGTASALHRQRRSCRLGGKGGINHTPPSLQPFLTANANRGPNFRRKFFVGLPFWVWGFLRLEKSKELGCLDWNGSLWVPFGGSRVCFVGCTCLHAGLRDEGTIFVLLFFFFFFCLEREVSHGARGPRSCGSREGGASKRRVFDGGCWVLPLWAASRGGKGKGCGTGMDDVGPVPGEELEIASITAGGNLWTGDGGTLNCRARGGRDEGACVLRFARD